MAWDRLTFRRIRSRVDFCRSVRGPFRSAALRRLAVLTEITDSGAVRSWIRSSNSCSFSQGLSPGLRFLFHMIYEPAGKETQKVLPPEERQSSGPRQWGHAEILPGQTSLSAGRCTHRLLATVRSNPKPRP